MRQSIVLSMLALGIVAYSANISEHTDKTLATNAANPSTNINETIPYLIFPGSCKQALEFYKETFKGEILMMQTFGESSMNVPEENESRIFNSEFRADNLHIMASDDMPGNEVKTGSNFALLVRFDDSAEKKRVFEKLSEGGTVLFPMEDNFGMVVDKFGIQWMIESTN